MTPDEVRQGIAANPQTAAERAELIRGAIENDIAEEIPDEWGVGVTGEPPADEPAPQVLDDAGFSTIDEPDMRISIDEAGTISIIAGGEPGQSIAELSAVDLGWLDSYAGWASGTIDTLRQTGNVFGERQLDPTTGLAGWYTIRLEGGGTIAVGHDYVAAQGDTSYPTHIVLVFNGTQRFRMTQDQQTELEAAITYIENVLGSEFNQEY